MRPISVRTALCAVLLFGLKTQFAAADQFFISLDPASNPAEYHIDAGSNGQEPIYLLQGSQGPGFYFSVDRVAVGAPNTPVHQESAPPNESAAADIYLAGFNGHTLYRQETALGLHPGFYGDDIDALQIVPDPPGPPLPDQVFTNVGFPYSSLWRNSSLIGQPATVNRVVPMADPDGLTGDDILLSLGTPNLLFASGVTDIGLMEGDDLDALMLLDVTPDGMGGFLEVPNGRLDPGLDMAIFSLDPFSPSTITAGQGGNRSPADLMITSFTGNYNLFRTAASLGLLMDDNLDALSMAAVPEPASLLLVFGGSLLVLRRRRIGGRPLARRARGPAGSRLNVVAACVTTLMASAALARPGDADGDNDVDLADVAAFQASFSGPGGGVPPDAAVMDFDIDEDIDLLDYAALHDEVDGPAGLGNPCASLGPPVAWGGISPPVANSVAILEFKYGTNPDVFCFLLSATHPAPGINLPGPGNISMPEQQADFVTVFPGAADTPTRIVFSHIFIVPNGAAGAGSVVTIEGDLLLLPYDRGVLDVKIEAPGGGASTTVRYLIRPLLDLDVDSDNNSTLMDRAPQRDANEETIEDDPTKTGVLLCVNDNDDDADGIVDFGDGFDLDNTTEDDDENAQEADFVKMVLAIGQHIDTSVASIRVMYSASDPAAATIAGTPPTITPAPGRLRIWTKRGTEIRNKASIANGGDYVAPGIYDASDFDFQLDAAAGQRKVELWLEGIRPSPSEGVDRIEFAVDPDGPGPQDFIGKDAVRSTQRSLKFIEAEEVAGVSLLPLFNPSPIVTLDEIADPGNAETVNINVTGTVKDYIAPMAKVRVNGAEVNVTPTSSGPDGLGPFEGTFMAALALTGNTTLVEATAINSLKNVGKDSTLIAVMRDMNFMITARMITENPSVPAAPDDEAAYLDSYRFKIEMRGVDPLGNQLDVTFDTGTETKTVTLTRLGNSGPLRSKDLFLVPENLMLPANASADVQNTRIKGDLGKRPQASYTNLITCMTSAVAKGILLRKKTDNSIADFVESAIQADVTNPQPPVQYEAVVGLHGSTGQMIDVKLRGLDNAAAELPQPMPMASFPPLEPTITLTRQSNNKADAEYHLYKQSVSPKPIMGVRTPLPVDGAGAPQANANITATWVEFDGALRCKYDPDAQIVLAEPVVGMEIVADRQAAPNTFKATGLIPVNNPAPPVLSVADGAPRPIIENFMVTYMPEAANPRRFRVEADIKDQLADTIDGNTLAAVGMAISIQPAPIAAPTVMINRPANDPPRPFLAHITAFVNLTEIPTAADVIAYRARRAANIRIGAAEAVNLKISQEAVILQASNAVGNRSWDSAFCQLNDPDADRMPPFNDTITNDARRNPPTLYDVPPQPFFARYHNPFKMDAMFTQTLSSRMAANEIANKQVALGRKLAGNTYSYGPFVVPTADRWVVNPPAIPAALPAINAAKYMHDAAGLVTGEMIADVLKVDAPAPSREDLATTLPLDLRISDQAAGGNMRDAFLPTGSDGMPTAVNITAFSPAVLATAGIPAAVRMNVMVAFRLKQVTNFQGFCTNSPSPGPPAPAGFMNDDFSFNAAGNGQGPTAPAAFDAMGEVRNTVHSKDFGGRAVLDGAVNIPGNAPRSVLVNMVVDDEGDFLPRSWERRFRNSPGVADANNPVRDGLEDDENRDITGAAVAHNERGDGYTALEEYRGFSVTFVPAGGGPPPLARRMDELPFDYGLAVTGAAANGNLVAGPRIKDVFVFHQSTVVDTAAGNLAMGTANAGLFNVAWHRVLGADFPAVPMLATPAGVPVTNHNHQMNPNGENDSLNTAQQGVHLRDDATLGAGILGQAGSFNVSTNDLRIRPASAGPNSGFGAPLINGNTIFHEIGHMMSLRHCHNTTSQGAAVFTTVVPPQNNMDVTGDAVPDGVLRITVTTYQPNGTAAGTTAVRGDTREECYVNNAYFRRRTHTFPATAADSFGAPITQRIVFQSNVVPAGPPAPQYFGRVLFPDLMDWTDFLIAAVPPAPPNPGVPGGPTQQQNLGERQIFTNLSLVAAGQDGPPASPAPAAAPLHNQEIRCRTVP